MSSESLLTLPPVRVHAWRWCRAVIGDATHGWAPFATRYGSPVVGGKVEAHLVTQATPARSWPFGRMDQECMWSKIGGLTAGKKCLRTTTDQSGTPSPKWSDAGSNTRSPCSTSGGWDGAVRDRRWEQYGPP